MQTYAAGYVFTYLTISKRKLDTWTVIGLTATKFMSLILPMDGFFLSNTSYIWIYMV
jgi:hypothetical protein